MLKTLIIDNYDSFVYNLVQYIWEFWWNPIIFRNDEISVEKARELNPTHIVISPWPWNPTDPAYFWVCNDIIREMWTSIPLLWVCLWHQWIWSVFGWKIIQCSKIMHGKTSVINREGDSIILNWLAQSFEVMRYHSLSVSEDWFPEDLSITSRTEGWTIMSFEHKKYPIYAVQFHPESIGTPDGKKMIRNFLEL